MKKIIFLFTLLPMLMVGQNAEDFPCPNNPDKVLICKNGNELCVSINALEGQLQSGATLGPCDTLGTDTFELDNNFNINDNFISVRNASNISIYSITGNKVLNVSESTVDISTLTKGVYILITQVDNKFYKKKLIL